MKTLTLALIGLLFTFCFGSNPQYRGNSPPTLSSRGPASSASIFNVPVSGSNSNNNDNEDENDKDAKRKKDDRKRQQQQRAPTDTKGRDPITQWESLPPPCPSGPVGQRTSGSHWFRPGYSQQGPSHYRNNGRSQAPAARKGASIYGVPTGTPGIQRGQGVSWPKEPSLLQAPRAFSPPQSGPSSPYGTGPHAQAPGNPIRRTKHTNHDQDRLPWAATAGQPLGVTPKSPLNIQCPRQEQPCLPPAQSAYWPPDTRGGPVRGKAGPGSPYAPGMTPSIGEIKVKPGRGPTTYQPQYGPFPYQPQYGPFPYQPQYKPFPYQPQYKPFPYQPQYGSFPYQPQYGSSPYQPQYGSSPYQPQYRPFSYEYNPVNGGPSYPYYGPAYGQPVKVYRQFNTLDRQSDWLTFEYYPFAGSTIQDHPRALQLIRPMMIELADQPSSGLPIHITSNGIKIAETDPTGERTKNPYYVDQYGVGVKAVLKPGPHLLQLSVGSAVPSWAPQGPRAYGDWTRYQCALRIKPIDYRKSAITCT